MALHICIPDLVKQGKIPEARAAEISALYDDLVRHYEGRFGRDAAEAMATTQALKALENTALQRKRTVLLQAKRQQTMLDQATRLYDGGAAGKPTGEAMLAHLVYDEAAPYANVEYRWKRIKQNAMGMMYNILANHRANLAGQLRNKADLDLIVRELHGEDTADLNAKELADAWRQTSEMLRQRFNAAGGHIGKLEGWALPHNHDSLAVGSVGPEAWIDDVMPRLDRQRMIDDSTSLPFSDEKLRLVLRDVYDTIVSEGWSKRSPGSMGEKSVGNRHAEHRFLHFKSADDWIAYNDQYGSHDAFSAMLGHVELMARDTAMMEILGPNPAATIKWMKDVAAKDAHMGVLGRAGSRIRDTLLGSEKMRALRGLPPMETAIDMVFAEITGANKRGGSRNLALFGATMRNWQSATKLGSAALTSISDAGTQSLTRAYNGLPAMNVLNGYVRQLNPLDQADRDFARRTGIIGDEYAGRAVHGSRMHMDEVFGMALHRENGLIPNALEASTELTRRLADGTLRVSGLNAMTNAGREAMGMEFMNALASYAPRSYAQLDAPFRKFLDRYGLGEAGWNAIRATPMTDYKGAQWILPETIADRAVADRLMEGILTEIDFAVPTGGLRQRALVNALPPGTILGEIVRTGFQFKMFPLTVMHMHGQRMMAQMGIQNKAIYAASFLCVTTLTGMMALQMSEISKGRDPLSLNAMETWKKSMLKGGGLGIYGDMINSATNEYGQGVGDITSGPTWGTMQNVVDLAQEGDLAKFMKRETPGGSIWYVRLVYERMLIDMVRRWSDPDAEAAFARQINRAENEGTQFWAAPGEGLSDARMPDFSNAWTDEDSAVMMPN